jgi:hypothetical protein
MRHTNEALSQHSDALETTLAVLHALSQASNIGPLTTAVELLLQITAVLKVRASASHVQAAANTTTGLALQA